MKRLILKLRIVFTNISRVIMSLLFVNLGTLLRYNVYASEPSCYFTVPTVEKNNSENVIFIVVPIVLIIILISAIISIIILKNKKKKDEKGE